MDGQDSRETALDSGRPAYPLKDLAEAASRKWPDLLDEKKCRDFLDGYFRPEKAGGPATCNHCGEPFRRPATLRRYEATGKANCAACGRRSSWKVGTPFRGTPWSASQVFALLVFTGDFSLWRPDIAGEMLGMDQSTVRRWRATIDGAGGL